MSGSNQWEATKEAVPVEEDPASGTLSNTNTDEHASAATPSSGSSQTQVDEDNSPPRRLSASTGRWGETQQGKQVDCDTARADFDQLARRLSRGPSQRFTDADLEANAKNGGEFDLREFVLGRRRAEQERGIENEKPLGVSALHHLSQ